MSGETNSGRENHLEKEHQTALVELEPPVAEDKVLPEFNKFIFGGPMFGGLGNQVFL